MYDNFRGLDHLETFSGFLRKLKLFFESFFDYEVWGMKGCGSV